MEGTDEEGAVPTTECPVRLVRPRRKAAVACSNKFEVIHIEEDEKTWEDV
jgi:hypothetical protein